ncbi:MAG: NTP transferase domain-containing protein [Candidatus Odinarchaeota archaeon]
MVFIKQVKSGEKTYYYLVHSYRAGDSVNQRTIKRLTPEEAADPDFITRFLESNPRYLKSKMKAIIPAAGKALRLSPYAQDIPKGLITVRGKPILQHAVDRLHASGISEIILITGFQDGKLRVHFKNEVKYIHNPFYSISGILASTWFATREMDGPLLVLYSDILFDEHVIKRMLSDGNDITVAVTSTIIDSEAERVIVEDSILKEIGRGIPDGQVNYEYAGITKFSEEGARYLQETIEEMAREEGFLDLYFTDALERLILKKHEIHTEIIPAGRWIDIDSPKDLKKAEEEILPNLQEKSQE